MDITNRQLDVTLKLDQLDAELEEKTGSNRAAIISLEQNLAESITTVSEMVNFDGKIKANTTAISTLSTTTDQNISSITNFDNSRHLTTTAELHSLNTRTTNLERRRTSTRRPSHRSTQGSITP